MFHFISETRSGFRCRATAQALDDWDHTLETTSRDGTKGVASSQTVDGAVLSRSVLPGYSSAGTRQSAQVHV